MKIIFTLCTCCLIVMATAQDKEVEKSDLINPSKSRGYIGLSIGPSFPIGSLARKENFAVGTGLTGQETTSIGLQLSLINVGYLFTNHVGIAGTWFGAVWQRKTNRNYKVDPWTCGSIMIGPLFSFPLSKKVDLDFRSMLGYAICSGQPEDASNTTPTVRGGSIAFDSGTILRIQSGKKLIMLFSLDYVATKIKFKANTTTPGANEQPMRALSVGVGLAFRIR